MKIKIKDHEVELKQTMRSLIYFENITNKTFNPQNATTLDLTVLFLCTLLASDKTLQLSYNELIDAIDDNPQIFVDYTTWFIDELQKQNMLSQDMHVEVDESKKA